jgi:hypothetical protein
MFPPPKDSFLNKVLSCRMRKNAKKKSGPQSVTFVSLNVAPFWGARRKGSAVEENARASLGLGESFIASLSKSRVSL